MFYFSNITGYELHFSITFPLVVCKYRVKSDSCFRFFIFSGIEKVLHFEIYIFALWPTK